jgi:hypothetical protein
VAESLVIPFGVVVGDELTGRAAQHAFAEEEPG